MSVRHSLTRSTHTALYGGYCGPEDYRNTGLRWRLKEITMSIVGTIVADRRATQDRYDRYNDERRGRGGKGWAS